MRIMSHGNRSHRPSHGLLEADHDVAFDVTTAFRHFFSAESAAATEVSGSKTSTFAPRAEYLLKEITEARAAEMKFLLPSRFTSTITTPACTREIFPTRRRLKFRALFPVGSQLVVFLALG